MPQAPTPGSRAPTPDAPSRPSIWAGLLLVVATVGAYANSFSGSLIFDDLLSILRNPSIRQLWPLGPVLHPPSDMTVTGRPILNISLAFNYETSGTQVLGYHLLNLAIHIAAGLLLFGIVRRTLLRPALISRFGADSTSIALVISLLWLLHPLQTESVTYVIQRAESLMGLFYLLTIYGFIVGIDAGGVVWPVVSVIACFLGMATKEVMATAPLIVLLYDRTFASESFREALARRRGYYLSLAASWLLLAQLVAGAGLSRGGRKGFGAGLHWAAYDATQFRAVLQYLRLSLWPHPLVFDYGVQWLDRPSDAIVPGFLVALLVVAALWALRKRSTCGFLGIWFFLILAPSSIPPGISQMTSEHRMYLSLAAVVALVVAVTYRYFGRRTLILFGALSLALGIATHARNRAYIDDRTIWQDTVDKMPDNARARYNLGDALLERGQFASAAEEFRAAVRINPGYVKARNNLGNALASAGDTNGAIAEYRAALQLAPRDAVLHYDIAGALLKAHRVNESVAEYSNAIQCDPNYADAESNLASVLESTGRFDEASGHFERAIELHPADPDLYDQLGVVLEKTGNNDRAEACYANEARLRPDRAQGPYNQGVLLLNRGDLDAALGCFKDAIQREPAFAPAKAALQIASSRLAEAGRSTPLIHQ